MRTLHAAKTNDRRLRLRVAVPIFFLTIGVLLAGRTRADDAPTADSLLKQARETFKSLTPLVGEAQANQKSPQVELGRKLFFDPRMSADGVWSCMLCHQPTLYGTDAQRLSRGVFDKFLPRNAPTVLNASLQFKAHWDGRFASVEEQASHALLGPGFGNHDVPEAMERIKSIPGYAEEFAKAFPTDSDPVTPTNLGTAIGAYERTLLTPSRFDEYLDGKPNTLSAAERKGLQIFTAIGCADCHDKLGLGGERFEKFGEVSDYWKQTKSQVIDQGRFEITKKEEDRYVFKTPSLRNVAMTPPYFHDGSVADLHEAVRIMAKVQLDVDLPEEQNQSIVTFLQSLTGDLPGHFQTVPVLPPGTFFPVKESPAASAEH